VSQLNEVMDDPTAGLCDVAALIAQDGPLAAKVLRIANSAYYGLHERCNSVEYASAMLGLRALRNIVTEASLVKEFTHLKARGFDLDDLWQHSLLTARTCARLSPRSHAPGTARADEMYVCGLLHDIGQVVLLDNLGDDYVALVNEVPRRELPLHEIERIELGTTHADVGATVAATWGFPASVVSAIRYHHAPRGSSSPTSVLVANVNLLVECVTKRTSPRNIDVFDGATLKSLGVSEQAVTDAIGYLEELIAPESSD